MKLLLAVIVCVALAQIAVAADRPRNIFDDDWTPPKTADKPRPPATVIPPTAPTPTPAPDQIKTATSKPPIPKPAPAIPVVPRRLPVPTKPAQAAVRQVMKEVFADQLADHSVPAPRTLAAALLAQADKSSQVPTDQFVLLAAVIDAAVDAVNLPAAFQAADRMAETFDVDGLGVKADAALRLGPKSAVPESAAAENVEAVLALSNDLTRAEDYATASRVCAALQPAAAREPALRAQLQQRQREIVMARDAADRFARDLARLKESPDDPGANLAVGRYACLVKGDWDGGLPLLVKGADPALRALAARELAHVPAANDETATIADAWWESAAKQPDVAARAAVTAHAAALYERCVGEIAGLRKAQIEKRIAEAEKLTASNPAAGSKHVVNLLRLIDPARDTVHGNWKLVPGGLTCDNQKESRLAIPYDPPEEYDYHVAFSRTDIKGETIHLMFSRNGHSAWLVLWGDNKITFGVQRVDDQERWANVTTGKLDEPFKTDQRYDCVIRVRKESVTALLDDKQLFDLKTDFTNLQPGGNWKLRDAKLGIGAQKSSASFGVIEIIEITGTGKPTASPAR